MIETILIATERKSGKDVLLAGSEVPFREQLEKYKKLCGSVNDGFSRVVLATVQPHKKPLKFITKTEAESRKKAHADAVANADKEAREAAKKSAAGKKAAKTETKTGTDTGSNSET